MYKKSDSPTFFSLDAIDTSNPAQITQSDWKQDKAFLLTLRTSWQSQYADYIGAQAAEALVEQLHTSGEIYEHSAPGTLVATLDKQLVGIAAVRDVQKLFLLTLFEVAPEHQGKGIAKQLLTAICTAQKPLLAHASIHRPWLKSFYEKQGFTALAPEAVEHYGHSMMFNVMIRA